MFALAFCANVTIETSDCLCRSQGSLSFIIRGVVRDSKYCTSNICRMTTVATTSTTASSVPWPFPTDEHEYCRVLGLAPKGQAQQLMQQRRQLHARKARDTESPLMRSTNNSESNDEENSSKRRVR